MKVLIVEDHADSRDLLHSLMRAEGYDVLVASTVAEAKKHMNADIVITDIRLPDGSGEEVQKTMAPLPVIAISGLSEPATGSAFYSWITKPVSISRLCQEIQRALAAQNHVGTPAAAPVPTSTAPAAH